MDAIAHIRHRNTHCKTTIKMQKSCIKVSCNVSVTGPKRKESVLWFRILLSNMNCGKIKQKGTLFENYRRTLIIGCRREIVQCRPVPGMDTSFNIDLFVHDSKV